MCQDVMRAALAAQHARRAAAEPVSLIDEPRNPHEWEADDLVTGSEGQPRSTVDVG